jgi:hypothetical protein
LDGDAERGSSTSTIIEVAKRRHAADTPVGKVSVEGGGAIKCAFHVGDAGHVPGSEIAIKGGGLIECVQHGGNAGHGPRRQVAVEGGGAIEHT